MAVLPNGTEYDALIVDVDPMMSTAISLALTSPMEVVQRAFDGASCPGAECTWAPYRSLALCGKCIDISSFINKSQACGGTNQLYELREVDAILAYPNNSCTTRVSLPNGQHIDVGRGLSLTAYDSYQRNESFALYDDELYIWSTTILQNDTKGAFSALECGISVCLNEYHSKFGNGSLIESTSVYPAKKTPDSWQPVPDWQLRADESFTTDPNQDSLSQTFEYPRSDLQVQGFEAERFNITQHALNTIGRTLIGTFSTARKYVGASGYCSDDGKTCIGAGLNTIYGRDFNQIIKAMGVSMTNTMRTYADNDQAVKGLVGVIVYKIRWPWIALSCVLIAASVLYLVWTIVVSRRYGAPIWKSSAFPLLLYGSIWAEDLHRSSRVGAIEQNAKQTMCNMYWPGSGELQLYAI